MQIPIHFQSLFLLAIFYNVFQTLFAESVENCYNKRRDCESLAKRGMCDKRDLMMQRECGLSCGFCKDTREEDLTDMLALDAIEILDELSSTCEDTIPGCAILKKRNMCARAGVDTKCKKTCNYCGSNCYDKANTCEKMKTLDFCTKRKAIMKKTCPATCGLCPSEEIRAPSPPVKPKPKARAKGKCAAPNKLPNRQCQHYQSIGWCEKKDQILKNCYATCVCENNSPTKPVTSGPCGFSTYGCCWDKVTTKQNQEGTNCPACKDDVRFEVLCSRFGGDCDTGGHLAKSLQKYCHMTCGNC